MGSILAATTKPEVTDNQSAAQHTKAGQALVAFDMETRVLVEAKETSEGWLGVGFNAGLDTGFDAAAQVNLLLKSMCTLFLPSWVCNSLHRVPPGLILRRRFLAAKL